MVDDGRGARPYRFDRADQAAVIEDFLVDRPVPVLVVPWLYLPLGERQTGLLLPVLGSTGASGFTVAQPLFITLGRSADATVTAEYAFGRKRKQVSDGKPAVR